MTDPLTREQVERAIVAARVGTVYLSDFLGPGINWSLHAPDYVCRLWISPPRPPQAEHIAALTRWRDELVAAETPRKVARYSAVDDRYHLTPEHDTEAFAYYRAFREQAIAWGYAIEGGPEPVDDTAPERLRERREALGWSLDDAARAMATLSGDDWYDDLVGSCEDPARTSPGWARSRAIYAAALSAAEAERAAKPEPAPEVVDVPQPPAPIVKRCGEVELWWHHDGVVAAAWADSDDAVPVPVPLLRAMLAAIDAQQPAPAQPTRPEPRYKVGDWVRVIPSRAIVFQVAVVQWHGWWVCIDSAGYGGGENTLTPAIDPALHETARKTVAWLRGGSPLVGHYEKLPGFDLWKNTADGSAANGRWAAQLERLLGDAP